MHQHHHHHPHHDVDDGYEPVRRRRDRRSRRDHGGHGRRRARRGAVGTAVLALLGERPMHGYELIGALEERSGGRWKPSAGTIYPALHRLEHRGFVTATEEDGRRRFELTEAGRARLEEHRAAGDDTPWDDHGLGHQGELRRAIAELVGPAKQIGRFGTPEQAAAAVAAIKEATGALYRILAAGPTHVPSDEPSTESGPSD